MTINVGSATPHGLLVGGSAPCGSVGLGMVGIEECRGVLEGSQTFADVFYL